MISIGKILYATDFSESSGPAADYACYLARLTGARIFVLHAVSELVDERKRRIQPETFSILEKEVEVHAVKEMEEFCRRKFAGRADYVTEVVLGSPFQQILARSKEIQADLIVMGTHGRTGIEHVLVGSTAERVVRRSAIPVLTVRG